MATKKAAKKAVKKVAPKTASKRATKSAKKGAKRAVKAVSETEETFEVDLVPLINLRDDDLKPLAQSPKGLTAQEAGALATKAHATIAAFLKKCGGPGGGESPTKIRVVGGN